MDNANINTHVMQAVAKEKGKGVPGSTVKMVAIIAMLIDHIAAVLITRVLLQRGLEDVAYSGDIDAMLGWMADNGPLYYANLVMRLVGRLGFPIFCFLLVEGFEKTRNVRKYALRLGLFAMVSEIPFNLAFKGSLFDFSYQNVFFTLFLGLAALCAYEYFNRCELPKTACVILCLTGFLMPGFYIVRSFFGWNAALFGSKWVIAFGLSCLAVAVLIIFYGKKNGQRKAEILCADLTVLFLAMLLADFLHTDYSGMGVMTITVMYLFRRGKVKSMLAGCITLTCMSVSEITCFGALIPAALYNGQRGWKMKYFFYAFYPVHLLLLYLIAVLMGMGNVAVV